jgi:hypothetical protein
MNLEQRSVKREFSSIYIREDIARRNKPKDIKTMKGKVLPRMNSMMPAMGMRRPPIP